MYKIDRVPRALCKGSFFRPHEQPTQNRLQGCLDAAAQESAIKRWRRFQNQPEMAHPVERRFAMMFQIPVGLAFSLPVKTAHDWRNLPYL
jgi:hypothetical protein